MDATMLRARVIQVQEAKQQHVQRQARLREQVTETIAQINALIGREAELTELLAIIDRPADHGEP